jgi:hypothetical protein
MLRLLCSLGVLVLVAAVAPLPVSAQQRSLSEFVQVAPDVYAFRYLGHVSMFIVGGDGVAVRDALASKYATWATFPAGLGGNILGAIRWGV